MDDSFTLGKPSGKHVITRARTPKPRRPAGRSAGSGTGRIVLLVVGGIVAVVAIAGFMTFVKGDGEQIASDEHTAVAQIGSAKDVDAKMTVQQATGTVQQLYAEQGSYASVTPAALKRFEPTFSYTASASTGPNIVSVSSSANGVGIAVLSESGTCFYERFATSGSGQGTGTTCTGAAALSSTSS